jgi:hypothetical protein
MAGRHGHSGHRLPISPRDLLTRHMSGSPADWPPSRQPAAAGQRYPAGTISAALSMPLAALASRRSPDPDGIVTARLHGTAGSHAGRDPLEVDAALAELREIAAGRADLLGELASSTPGSALVWPCRGTQPCVATERTRRPPDHPGPT